MFKKIMSSRYGLLILMVITVIIFMAVVMDMMPANVMRGEDAPVQEDITVYIAAGPQDSADYQLAEKIAKSINDEGIDSQAVVSGSYAENMKKIIDGEAPMAIVLNSSLGANADAASVIAQLGQVYVQAFATDGSSSLEEAAGKNIAVGIKDSAEAEAALAVLQLYGIGPDDFTPVYGDAAAALNNGEAEIAIIIGDLGSADIGSASLLALDNTDSNNTVFKKSVIPAGTYGQADDVATLSIDKVLVATSTYSDGAFSILKSILDEALPELL